MSVDKIVLGFTVSSRPKRYCSTHGTEGGAGGLINAIFDITFEVLLSALVHCFVLSDIIMTRLFDGIEVYKVIHFIFITFVVAYKVVSFFIADSWKVGLLNFLEVTPVRI